jgi:hypothetical protein
MACDFPAKGIHLCCNLEPRMQYQKIQRKHKLYSKRYKNLQDIVSSHVRVHYISSVHIQHPTYTPLKTKANNK